MRAVWSFWQEPFAEHRASVWGSEKTHLLAWVLSLETARRHYSKTTLVTDDAGARILIDGLGLEFETVSLALNDLRGCDPSWWSAGKLVAIADQHEPFVHVDADVFLWAPLPAALTAASVFAQNPEPFVGDVYAPEAFELALAGHSGTWLPEEWGWHVTRGAAPRGECCGIVGGTNVSFLRHYANQGLRLIREPGNRALLDAIPDRPPLMTTVEQYLLSACIEHHRGRPGSPYPGIRPAYLFESWQAAERNAPRVGYTHLIADSKRDPINAARLERRVWRDYPHRHEQCLRLLRARRDRRAPDRVARSAAMR